MLSPDLNRHVGKYYGKYAGFVADDPEPDEEGALFVQVPNIFGATKVRARACQPYGHFFLPHPKARIWVEFECGDTRYPLWVGVWYPEASAPVETKAEPQTHRVIQTSSGHTIEISDEDGAEKIIIRHKDDSFVALETDGSVIVSNKKGANLFLNAGGGQTTLTSEQGHLVTMGDEGIVLVNDAGSVYQLKGDTATILASKVVVSGTSVGLGVNAAEPTIMGMAFKALWQLVVAHVHPTAMGPSGPPTPPILPIVDAVHLSSSVVVK